MPGSDVAARFEVEPSEGLSSAQVTERTERYGPNRLAEPPRRSNLLLFLDQFRSGIVYLLAGAAVLAGAFGDLKDPIVIAVVLVFNAVLGYVQEAKASNALDALKEMLVARVRVRRDGSTTEVTTDDLVPGDVVLLEAGDRVPADGRVLMAANLSVDESALTGTVPFGEREDGGEHGVCGRERIAWSTREDGRAVGPPRDPRHTGDRLHRLREAGVVTPGTAQSVRGHAGEDDARIRGLERVERQPEVVHHSHAVVLDHAVGHRLSKRFEFLNLLVDDRQVGVIKPACARHLSFSFCVYTNGCFLGSFDHAPQGRKAFLQPGPAAGRLDFAGDLGRQELLVRAFEDRGGLLQLLFQSFGGRQKSADHLRQRFPGDMIRSRQFRTA